MLYSTYEQVYYFLTKNKYTMKKFIPLLSLVVALSALSFTSVKAQCSIQLGSACVGACGAFDEIIYTVPSITDPAGISLCIKVDNYSLCPTHRAGIRVWINDVPLGKARLTPTFQRSFNVMPGDVVRIRGGIKEVATDPACLWLGEVHFSLNR